MALYCAPTPPLIAGNKVCVGKSRVGHGCEDALGTGVCATHPLEDCQHACRLNHDCEMFVFFPEEKQGTCILCRDMADTIPTPEAASRIYATTPAPPPPSSPRGKVQHHYTLIEGPSPPPPPRPPPRPPFAPPRPLSRMGRHHTREHFECSFMPGVELSVDASEGYTDRSAGSKEECCNTCGLKAGCQDFVFEPSSGTCVLLPHVSQDKISHTKNEYTVSGSLQITIVKKSEDEHGTCDFLPSSGYSGGSLGEGQPLVGGHAIESKQDCCDACDRDERCAKFTYETYSHSCMLYEAFAEKYLTDGLLSGVVSDRSSKAIQAPHTQRGSSEDDISQHIWMRVPPPPVPPMIAWANQFGAPPAAAPLQVDTASEVLAYVSLGIGGLMVFMFLLCAYCFFREDILRLLGMSSGKKSHNRKTYAVAPVDDGERRRGGRERDCDRRKSRERETARDKEGRRKKRGAERASAGYANVRVETKALTQKKEVYVADCDDCASLRKRIREEFPSVCGSKNNMLLFCLEPSPEGGEEAAQRWLLVVSSSDVKQVVDCSMLRMIERPADHDDSDYSHAFLPEGKKGKGKGKKGKSKRKDEEENGDEVNGEPERFDDAGFA